jgi:hypothetical protein
MILEAIEPNGGRYYTAIVDNGTGTPARFKVCLAGGVVDVPEEIEALAEAVRSAINGHLAMLQRAREYEASKRANGRRKAPEMTDAEFNIALAEMYAQAGLNDESCPLVKPEEAEA